MTTPGFRVRDPVTGAIKVDGTKRILILGNVLIVPANSSGTIIADVLLSGEPFCFCTAVRSDSGWSEPYGNLVPTLIGISGNELSYVNQGAAHRLMIGAY